MSIKLHTIFFLSLCSFSALSQTNKSLDKIVAIIGEKIILASDLEQEYQSYLESQMEITANTSCKIFEEIVVEKLLLNQAEIDSVEVDDVQVAGEIERRLSYFLTQFGSQQKLEEFYGKSLAEIKEEFRVPIKEQLTAQMMQAKISSAKKLTPIEVKNFFESIPKDSLPLIDSEVEIAQILIKPKVSEDEINKTKEKLSGLRDRIKKGEDFGTLAFLYSEDPGSARENGDLGFMSRGQLVPEFSAVAFALELGEVSNIVETEYGFHIIQLIERRGQEANFKHILLTPKIKNSDLIAAKNVLDSLRNQIINNPDITFEKMAKKYSDDKETKNSNGILTNPYTGSPSFEMSEIAQIDPPLVYTLDKLNVGDISEPVLTQTRDGKRAYRIVYLKKASQPHRANLKDDYQRLSDMAANKKRQELIVNWVEKIHQNFYIRIDEDYQKCALFTNWQLAKQ